MAKSLFDTGASRICATHYRSTSSWHSSPSYEPITLLPPTSIGELIAWVHGDASRDSPATDNGEIDMNMESSMARAHKRARTERALYLQNGAWSGRAIHNPTLSWAHHHR